MDLRVHLTVGLVNEEARHTRRSRLAAAAGRQLLPLLQLRFCGQIFAQRLERAAFAAAAPMVTFNYACLLLIRKLHCARRFRRSCIVCNELESATHRGRGRRGHGVVELEPRGDADSGTSHEAPSGE